MYGPYDLPRNKNGLINATAAAKRQFWAAADERVAGLSTACGCYVFAVKAYRGALPWYVGRTTKRSFKDEAVGAHQVNHYNQVVAGKVGVIPRLYLIVKQTPSGRFAKPSKNSHSDIEFLEIFLFGVALKRNSALRNARSTKFFTSMVVPGIVNSPQRPPTLAERQIKAMFGV